MDLFRLLSVDFSKTCVLSNERGRRPVSAVQCRLKTHDTRSYSMLQYLGLCTDSAVHPKQTRFVQNQVHLVTD